MKNFRRSRMYERGKRDTDETESRRINRQRRGCRGEAERDARPDIRLVVGAQKQPDRERKDGEQNLIIVESIGLGADEKRIEHHRKDDQRRAPAAEHAQPDQINRADRDADHDAGQRVGRPMGRRKCAVPDARDPAGERRMAAVTAEELHAPGVRLGAVHKERFGRLHQEQDEHAEDAKDRDGNSDAGAGALPRKQHCAEPGIEPVDVRHPPHHRFSIEDRGHRPPGLATSGKA